VSKLGVGAVFAGFRIEALLGRGGMGSVYRARDLALDSERALKVLEPELTADRAFRERFQREARLAAQIENPAVVPVYQAGEDDGRLFIAMRLIRGPDLHRLVAKDGPLEPQRTARIVAAVAAALDEAHARGIVHRDVKPANILVELSKEGERVFLTDFGISRSARPTEEVTSTGQLLGTADYISPEQIEGERADARSDVYALGCVVCYLLTGEPPFRRDTELATLYAHAHAARPRPSLLEPGLPAAIDEVVVRATAVDPDGRHQSAGELADDLRRALAAPSGETWATAAAETAGPTQSLGRRVSIGKLAAVALAIAAIAVAVVLLAGGGGDTGSSGGTTPDVATIGLGDAVDSIVVGNVNVLAGSQRDSTLTAIDPDTGKPARDPDPIPHPSAVSIGFGSVWVTSASRGELLRYAPGHRRKPIVIDVGAQPSDIAVDDRWVWVANREDGTVSQIDPETDRTRATVEVAPRPDALATGEGTIWVASPGAATLTRLRQDAPLRSPRSVEVDGSPEDLTVFDGELWVVDSQKATLTARSLADGSPVGGPVALGGSPVAVTSGPEAVWVVDAEDDTATRIDPQSRDAGDPVSVGERPAAVAVGSGSIWVANAGDGTVSRITP
jgi:tRNA A-37 threonylcarbamoyl transferase component Bud32